MRRGSPEHHDRAQERAGAEQPARTQLMVDGVSVARFICSTRNRSVFPSR